MASLGESPGPDPGPDSQPDPRPDPLPDPQPDPDPNPDSEGQPQPGKFDLLVLGSHDPQRFAAEAMSEHPLAAAVLAAARDRGLALPQATGVRAAVGQGLSASVEGRAVLIGNAGALTGAGVALSPRLVARAGQTMVRAETSGSAACSIGPATVQQG